MEDDYINEALRRGLRESVRDQETSLADVAQRAGLDLRTVKHLDGQSTTTTLIKICGGLGCLPSDLFAGSFVGLASGKSWEEFHKDDPWTVGFQETAKGGEPDKRPPTGLSAIRPTANEAADLVLCLEEVSGSFPGDLDYFLTKAREVAADGGGRNYLEAEADEEVDE